jgi:hypothetical protein
MGPNHELLLTADRHPGCSLQWLVTEWAECAKGVAVTPVRERAKKGVVRRPLFRHNRLHVWSSRGTAGNASLQSPCGTRPRADVPPGSRSPPTASKGNGPERSLPAERVGVGTQHQALSNTRTLLRSRSGPRPPPHDYGIARSMAGRFSFSPHSLARPAPLPGRAPGDLALRAPCRTLAGPCACSASASPRSTPPSATWTATSRDRGPDRVARASAWSSSRSPRCVSRVPARGPAPPARVHPGLHRPHRDLAPHTRA